MNTKFSRVFLEAMDTIFESAFQEATRDVLDWTSQLESQPVELLLTRLEKNFQKVEVFQEDNAEGTYAARLWYNGRGMLPPNIEIYRVPTQAEAIRGLYAAARLAFYEEEDDSQ